MSIGVARAGGLEGIRTDPSLIQWNLSVAALYEEAVRRNEGEVAAGGPLACLTGQHTGRSPNDKFIVREASSEAHVAWGNVNRPMTEEHFATLRADLFGALAGRELFV